MPTISPKEPAFYIAMLGDSGCALFVFGTHATKRRRIHFPHGMQVREGFAYTSHDYRQLVNWTRKRRT